MPEKIARAKIHQLIKDHSRVFIQGGTGEPSALVEALEATPDIDKPVEYVCVSIPGINRFNPAAFHQGAEFTTFFVHSALTPPPGIEQKTHFYPLHYRDIYRFLQQSDPFDIALIQLAPPDDNGLCSLGISVDFVPAIIDQAKLIIAEINPNMPASPHSPKLAWSALDYIVRCDHSPVTMATAPTTVTSEKIADHVSSLIDDGSCLQVGVGKLPGAILRKLTNHQRLGFHSGLLCQEVKDLIDAGVITGEQKTLDKNRHVTGIALGNQELYKWCADHSHVDFRAVDYTHDIRTIAAIDNFISINSVLEIDLMGQANAEMINGKQVSAVGGLVDFARGARYSKNGKSILALPATALSGCQSRIVPQNTLVSVCRSDIDYVVTEYGIARLADKSVEKRADSLIDIAAPEFKSSLQKQVNNEAQRPITNGR